MRGVLPDLLTIAGRGCVAALALALVLHGSTKHPPDGLYPPLANEWAKGNVVISGWKYLGRGVWPEPGYVVGHPASVGSGHVGIVDFDGEGVAAGRTEVNRRYDGFLDGTSGFSVYMETGGDSHDE